MSLGVQAAQAAWARALLEGLREGGVEALVLSPGSRSTPFALAAHALEFSIHVAIDERAAAFFALGRARLMARPSLLLCTSGSAPAHYLPALVEASMARIPLIALTADRPPELHHCGANQSVDQRGLFGSFVRASAELGPPRSGESLRLAMGRIGAWAVARSLHPEPGPVHLNAPAIEPLEPPLTPPASPPPGAADASTHRTTRVALPRMRPDPVALAALVRAARASRSGWLVVGPLGPQRASLVPALRQLAARLGLLLLAEATSQLRFGALPEESVQGPEPLLLDPFEPLLRSSEGRRRLAPDFILQLGAMPTSKGLGLLFAEASCPRIAITPWGWPDPSGAASELLYADLEEAVDAIEAILDAGGEEGWGAEADGAPSAARSAPRSAPPSAARDAANAAHAEAHSEALRLGAALHLEQDRLLETEPGLSEAACVRELLAALPEGSLLTVANSLSVRQLDAWVPSRPAGLRVASQRGASGIDGSIAGALGAASAHRGPSALLLGDIAFLHDLGSLLLARDHAPRRWPFVILAVNNDGGRIFEQLPIAGRRDLEAQLSRFITPHGLELAPLARGLGLPHRQVGDRASLREALEGALDSSGCTVIEARVPPGVAASLERRCAAFVESLLAQTGAR